jgi:sarcosine oxidase, subunit beta
MPDVVVIGAGIHGLSISYQLRLRGASVMLLDAGGIGAGASGRGTGIIRHHYSNALLVQMALLSRRMFETLAEEQPALPLVSNGLMVVVGSEEAEGLEANVRMQQAEGVDTDLLTPSQAKALVPELSTDGLSVGCIDRKACYTDSPRATGIMARKALEAGVELRTGERVLEISCLAGRIDGVQTNLGRINASVVVNAAGPWAAKIGALAGVGLPITPIILKAAALLPRRYFAATVPSMLDMTSLTYWRPEPGGQVFLGGGDESDPENPHPDPDTYRYEAGTAYGASSAAAFHTRLPGYGETISIRQWAGLDAWTPDSHPIIGEVRNMPGFFCAVGFSGHGFKLGPAVGLLLAEMIVDGRAKTLDLTPLAFDRFAEGRLLRSKFQRYPYVA